MISSFFKTQTVQRCAAGQYVKGKWHEGDETELSIKASVQPATIKEMEALPEGRRTGSVIKIYSDTLLQSAMQGEDEQEPTSPDTLTWAGAEWEVVACSPPYQDGKLKYYKAFAVEVTEGD